MSYGFCPPDYDTERLLGGGAARAAPACLRERRQGGVEARRLELQGEMADTGVAVGIYQNQSAAREALRRLRSHRFRRSAAITAGPDGRVSVDDYDLSPAVACLLGGGAGLVVGILFHVFSSASLPEALEGRAWLLPSLLALAGGVLGLLLSGLLDFGVSDEALARYRRWVVRGETLIVVEMHPRNMKRALEILREVKYAPPVTFAFHPRREHVPRGPEELVRRALLTAERIAEEAVRLASAHETQRGVVRGQPLGRTLRRSEQTLLHVYHVLDESTRAGQAVSLSGQWLLDNHYLIQGHIDDIRHSVPRRYYEELPVLKSGPHAGLPRIYAMACEMVANTDARLDREMIHGFLQSYQSKSPLTIGELWALPMMLRLRLIETLGYLSTEVERRHGEREQADFVANRLLAASRRDPDALLGLIAELSRDYPQPSAHLTDQLIGNLYDEEMVLAPVQGWLHRKLGGPITEFIQQEHRDQAAEQQSLSNAIGSLRLLSQIDWRDIFESTSRVDAVLWTEPAGVYSRMDFATRDLYRHAVEEISRNGRMSEIDVALHAVALAEASQDDWRSHVGYFLVDDGREELERAAGTRPPLSVRAQRWARRHAAPLYLGSVSAATAGILYPFALAVAAAGAPLPLVLLISALALVPASEIAVQTVNYLVTRLMPPRPLPKLGLQEGVPNELATLVVVPMMLLTPEAIRSEVERLEVRYLANPDPNIRFGLLSDYADAPQENMPEDLERLEVAVQGIEALNERYGQGSFFLFHRDRAWSESEQKWIGYERKRGKLEDLNSYLVGESDPRLDTLLRVGDPGRLQGIQFVITLDADTQLPRETARRLIGAIAHPLNRPRLSEDGSRVLRGYTIIQPRVTTSLPSATATLFSRLFTDASGVDPYTHAVSDVYQDLAGEGSYHGKGIYDLRAFHRILHNRFPPAHLLSHDLIEGAHVRVGLASDIELLDLFPTDYVVYAKRQHRWVRGDWQIIDWLKPRVPTGRGELIPNPLNALNRWKILDNLRRSLVPVGSVALLAAAWLLTPAGAAAALLVAAAMLFPPIAVLFTRLTTRIELDHRVWRDLGITAVRAALMTALLPHQAALTVDAVCRVFYRRAVSRRLLLEWETAAEAHRRSRNQKRQFIARMLWIPLFAVGLALSILLTHPENLWAAGLFLASWAVSPAIVAWLNAAGARAPQAQLTGEDRRTLRRFARLTWRFFDDFVGPHTNWLPPDNYQEQLNKEVAQRTSPTNIGLNLLANLSARDLGYQTVDQFIDRTLASLEVVDRLERFEGHLLNWYDIRTLEPLLPRYISFVDSGNLLGCLWVLEQAVDEILESPVVGRESLQGLEDTLALLRDAQRQEPDAIIREAGRILAAPPASLPECVAAIRRLFRLFGPPADSLPENAKPADYWRNKLASEAGALNVLADRYLSWVEILQDSPSGALIELGPHAHELRREALESAPSLAALAEGAAPGLRGLMALHARIDHLKVAPPTREWVDRLADAIARAQWFAGEQRARALDARRRARSLADSTNLRFLYDPERRLFHIGYNVSDRRMDTSYYDLLGSEARLGSFAAVASGEVPPEHWWALGRSFTSAYGQRAMLSWSGTMFEYLMPLLLQRSFENSLLDEACRAAVQCQKEYSRQRAIPWGISEAAFSALDAHRIYQYRAFGVPGLGLKRGLEEDLVVTPYATALALHVDPIEATNNLRRLATQEAGLLGDYGFYESIDYTRERAAEGQRGVIVYAYMAHHQGMILISIDNALNASIMQRRFHRDPRVKSAEFLLYEKIPTAPLLVRELGRDAPLPRLTPRLEGPPSGRLDTADTPWPRTNLLSNGQYSVLITNAGGGWSRWRDIEITRWRVDTTRDAFGTFCYIRDLESGAAWSATHHPLGSGQNRYTVIFTAEKAEFRRRDAGIESVTEVVVSPEDNVEVRLLTLTNRSLRSRRLEVTSYAEVSLAPHAADRAHPAFSKLFVETEALGNMGALLARRRPRSSEDPPQFAMHAVSCDSCVESALEYETDRARFLGRGRTPRRPAGLDHPLSNTAGAVLDPIFALRKRVTLEAGGTARIAFVTGAAETREQLVALAEKYCDLRAATRALEMAWTHAQLEMRHLRLQGTDVQRYQQLASLAIYPHAHLRPSAHRLLMNRLGQSRLWAHGISGDLPIVVVMIGNSEDVDVARDILIAHNFWRHRGLKADLVILNEEAASYEQPLQAYLQRLIQAHANAAGVDQPGGVHLRLVHQLSEEDLTLIQAAARIVIVATRGPIDRQLGGAVRHQLPPPLPEPRPIRDEPSPPLAFMELPYFNGLGGFTRDGREYAIYLGPGDNTPMPWVNVMANPDFGALVTESGAGFCWYGNSQSNRLTPWSNDPISDPPGDAIYIRDEDLGMFWTPTPLPIRELDAYRARHGQGYTIFEHNSHALEQELLTFVPVEAPGHGPPVRIQRLRLRNRASRKRRLTITAYCEWTLGVDREDSQQHIITQWDVQSHALLARNPFHPDFPERIAFLAASAPVTSYTADRAEFIGRNGSPAEPAALRRTRLSNNFGAGLDPCGVIQTSLEMDPGAEAEIVILLGQGADIEEARSLAQKYRHPRAAEQAFQAVRDFWDGLLGVIQVETPDLAVDLLLNRWLLYQTLSCRLWGRSAFYQSGGAYGFRDQLQDVMALVYAAPELAREHILRASSRQFKEGDVQHWWHPPSGAGVRTQITDDLLWLPFVTAHYVRVTGDSGILNVQTPYLEGRMLEAGEHEAYFTPETSVETATLLEHCRRALERGTTQGPHGLPLIGSGDWNDGLNRVGIEGRGESVWLAWFLAQTMRDFAGLLEDREDPAASEWREQAARLTQAVDAAAWDGGWYLRAFYDDGAPLGSARSEEARIDSLPQSWAVITGGGDPQRAKQALESVYEHLVRPADRMVLLFTPPFNQTPRDPGYIKGYLPGVRENGGQYTHGSLWVPIAFARRGDGDRAVELLTMMSPIQHTREPRDVQRYKVEPYVAAADIYALEGQVGRGGWTWYTGSGGWMYRAWVEEVLGLQIRGGELRIHPVVPAAWQSFRVRYRHGAALYDIHVENRQAGAGTATIEMDGRRIPGDAIPLVDDGGSHEVHILLGEREHVPTESGTPAPARLPQRVSE